MKSVNTWNLTHNQLHQLFKDNKEFLSIKVRGNTWEPLTRWLRLDSRIFRETTSKARITLCDIESLAEIYNYRSIRWKAKKLTPLPTKLIPKSLKNIFRKLPIIKQLAYELEIFFYKYSVNISDNLISIVIPARNEAGNKKLFINALNKLKKMPNKFEIIFVEGNSHDDTYKILQELKENFSDCFKISLLKQTSKGKKNAVVEGFNISKGETLAIIDSDFTVDIDDSIAAIIESTKNENILINCARTTFPMEKDAMRWANYIGNRLFAIFLFLVDSIIAAILSSISTVKSLSIMARVSPEEILNPSTTAFFFPLEVCFIRDILKKFEKFSFNSFKISYVLSLLLPSTNIISNL